MNESEVKIALAVREAVRFGAEEITYEDFKQIFNFSEDKEFCKQKYIEFKARPSTWIYTLTKDLYIKYITWIINKGGFDV